jgi:hypothetical protein
VIFVQNFVCRKSFLKNEKKKKERKEKKFKIKIKNIQSQFLKKLRYTFKRRGMKWMKYEIMIILLGKNINFK